MFIAVYEFEIKPGAERAFRAAWLDVTKSIYRYCGSFGSRLHTSEQPHILLGYAQWPSKVQWEKEHHLTDPLYLEARETMQKYLIRSRTVYKLEVCDDYLHAGPFEDNSPSD